MGATIAQVAWSAATTAGHLVQWLVGNAQGLTGIAAFTALLVDAAGPARHPVRSRFQPALRRR